MPALPLALQPAYEKYHEAEEAYKEKSISKEEFTKLFEEFVAEGAKLGVTISFYDEANNRRPAYPVGNNGNRKNFTYGPENKKWQKMQRVMKPATIMAINKWHKWIMSVWDKDAFVYDDHRMKILDKTAHDLVDRLFDHEDRKLNFMHKAVDIFLFYMKEDIYYAGRIFLALNSLPYFVLTSDEIENIQGFTSGVGALNAFTGEAIERKK